MKRILAVGLLTMSFASTALADGGDQYWSEVQIVHVLAVVLSVGSFGFFVLRYFIKQIKEVIADLRKKPPDS
jgi:hypothetical protein